MTEYSGMIPAAIRPADNLHPWQEFHVTTSGLHKAKILVVDDEPDILELVRVNLMREGYSVAVAESGEQALEQARSFLPDLVILDLMLPGIDGLDVCRKLKSTPATASTLVLMLSAKVEDADIVTGLELGADDYVTKPFSPRVLLGRIRALLRRRLEEQSPSTNGLMHIGGIAINQVKHEVRVDNHPVDLTVTEYRILLLLASRLGWVFSREQIVDAARGVNTVVTSRSVDVHIVRLRRKLEPFGELIHTVRGIGYRMSPPEEK